MLKRYLLFCGSDYYPDGGWKDFHSSHDSAAEAIETVARMASYERPDWWHILDLETLQIVKDSKE